MIKKTRKGRTVTYSCNTFGMSLNDFAKQVEADIAKDKNLEQNKPDNITKEKIKND